MANPFKWSIENNNFSFYTNEQIEEIANEVKFELVKEEDNKKCWFFSNYDNIDDRLYENCNSSGDTYNSGRTPEILINAIDPENNNETSNDEAAANSVVNVKNMDITIFHGTEYLDEFKKFFTSMVAPYLYYMIPSTCIFNLKIEEKEE